MHTNPHCSTESACHSSQKLALNVSAIPESKHYLCHHWRMQEQQPPHNDVPSHVALCSWSLAQSTASVETSGRILASIVEAGKLFCFSLLIFFGSLFHFFIPELLRACFMHLLEDVFHRFIVGLSYMYTCFFTPLHCFTVTQER